MDTVTLVENQIEDGQKLLDRLREDGFDFRAACWVKPVEEDRWSLYVATPVVDQVGVLEAYRQVLRAFRSLGEVWISDSDIKLIGEKHPVAQDVFDLLQRFPGRTPLRIRPALLGGIPFEDEVYLYAPKKKNPVEVTIYGLIFHGDPSGGLHLSLEPHVAQSMIVTERGGERNEYPAETGIDWVVAAPEEAALERNKNGQMELDWNLRGNRIRSSANEVWSLAKLRLHGFRFLREPHLNGSVFSSQP
jgi:hypothetical protein